MIDISKYNRDFESVWAAMDKNEKERAEAAARFDKQMAEWNAKFEKDKAEWHAKFEKEKAEDRAKMAEWDAKFEKDKAEWHAKFEKEKAEDRAKMAEWDAKFEKDKAEWHAKFEKEKAEDRAKNAEWDAKFEKQKAEDRAKMDEYYKELKETRKDVGGISKSYGMHAESYFFQSLKKTKQFGGIAYDFVDNDVCGALRLPNKETIDAQFDIVMTNGDSVAIIEIKSRVQKEDVKNLVNKKLDDFKNLFLKYANYKIYLGIAGFAYEKKAEKEALDNGVGILKLSGDNLEIIDEHLKAY